VEADLFTLCIAVFLDVGLGTLEDDSTLLLVGLDCDIGQQWSSSNLKYAKKHM
jgi:hypothetical protein